MAAPGMIQWNAATNGDIGQAFERASALDDTSNPRLVLVSIVQAWTVHKRDGVILTIEGGQGQQHHPMPNVLAIEFYNKFQTASGVPCIQIQASLPASVERARHFFDPDDDIVTMNCTKSAFDKIVAHLKNHVSTKENLTDIKSGGPLIQGFIVPLTM